jgi:glycosyltransferase involved in cell wall biosynthesis
VFRQLAARGCTVRLVGGTCLNPLLGSVANVELLPGIPRSAVPNFLAGLDCFVYRTSSRFQEAYGRVVAEALACGVPVIVESRVGASKHIEHGVNGFIANTDAAWEMLAARYPRHAGKIHLIWNGYDPENTLRALPIPVRSARVLLHAGSIYGRRQPSAMISSLERLIAAGRLDPVTIRLKLVGYLVTEDAWVRACPFHRLVERGCLEFTEKPVPRAEAAREMAQADYLVLLDLNGSVPAMQVPAKLFEYIQIGRPILAFTARNSPAERILARSGIRHVCVYPDSTPDEVDERLLQILRMQPEPATASKWFFEEFDGAQQTRRLAGIMDELSHRARGGEPGGRR